MVELKKRKGVEQIRLLMDLLFVDDAPLTTDCPVKLQKIVDVFVEVTDAYGQEVSVKKTEVMWVGKLEPGAQPPRVNIRIQGQQLKQVTEFRYFMGSTETEKASIDKEV